MDLVTSDHFFFPLSKNMYTIPEIHSVLDQILYVAQSRQLTPIMCGHNTIRFISSSK